MSELGVVTTVETQVVGAPGPASLVLVRPGLTAHGGGLPERLPAIPVLRVAVLAATPLAPATTPEPALAPVVRLADRVGRTRRR